MEVERRSFLNSAVEGVSVGKNPGIHRIEGWMGQRAGLHDMKKRKSSCPSRDEPRTFQPVTQSVYTLLELKHPDRNRTLFLIGLNVDALKLYKKYHKTPCGTRLQGWVRTGSSCHYNPGPRKCSKTMNVFRVYTERRGCMEPNARTVKAGWKWTAQIL